MAESTFRTRALVLRKTKLGESDLILTLLAQDGSQLRAVAKGARKPTNPFSSRLELYCESDLLLASRPSLAIVKEARLANAHDALRTDFDRSACAAVCAETLERLSQEDLPHQRLYPMASSALSALERGDPAHALAACAAFVLKAVSVCGFRPSLSQCALCGCDIELAAKQPGESVWLSMHEGGVLCEPCRRTTAALRASAGAVQWLVVLMMSTFEEISALDVPFDVSYGTLDFSRQWIREHIGVSLKSIAFLFTCGQTDALHYEKGPS